MFDGTEVWYKIWRKTDLCFLKWYEEFGKFSFTGWKKNDFILESKMTELNKNKNSERPDPVWKLKKFFLRNKRIAQLTKLFTYVLQNCCS